MSEESIVRKRYRITGRVQGVFYRAWTRKTALSLELTGTVQNLHDGSVEAFLRGPAPAVEAMAEKFWEGSPASKVDSVEAEDTLQEIPHHGFEILF